jgi:hypothetical protein
MKYLTVEPFKKHLEASFPNSLSQLYLVVTVDDFERSKLIDNIVCYLPRSLLSSARISSSSMKEIFESLSTPSLFGGENVFVIDELDNLKTQDIQLLTSFLKQNRFVGFVVLGARNKKSLLTLYNEIDKKGVVLDLSSEKSWDKEKRLSNFIVEKCARAKKSIEKDAIALIFDFIGTDMASIENEVEKVTLYVGDKFLIEKKDVLEICSISNFSTVWQMAEEIIWEESPFDFQFEKSFIVDSVFFHSLVIALRYHLQEGFKMASAVEKKLILIDLFPTLKPKVLQKRKDKVSMLGTIFFKKALQELFEIDMLSKSNISSFLTLLDLFRAKICAIGAQISSEKTKIKAGVK